MNLQKYDSRGIQVIFQNFKHPVYPQLFDGFEPYMSVVDLIFNCGEKSLQVLRGNE